MSSLIEKPNLIFFQHAYDEKLPEFLLLHKRDHVTCLQQFFNVSVVDQDCDYQEVCDRLQADIALFEGGVPFPTCRRPIIRNVRNRAEIPKVGLLNADAFCCSREGFLSDMDQWGIDTIFAIATTAAEHTAGIAHDLFLWPNCIDPKLFRDYEESKIVPVLFTGNKGPLYPWRRKVLPLISERFPVLSFPHPGYAPRSSLSKTVWGEGYARTINASWIVPTCGSAANEVLRKHFEIPACRACLITQRSPGLIAAGFVDMENCVFADETDIVDKIAYLFENPDHLSRIIDSGHRFVQTNHTLMQRDQIFQWFRLKSSVGSDQRIVQRDPFGPLDLVPRKSVSIDSYWVSNGAIIEVIREADRALDTGQYKEAVRLYLKSLNFVAYMPEPKLKLALCNLYMGKPKIARTWIVEPIAYTLDDYGAQQPDPIEWAYFLVSLLCIGRVHEAQKRRSQLSSVAHTELDWVHWVLDWLRVGSNGTKIERSAQRIRCRSIHRLPERPFELWREEICKMLRACREFGLADEVARCPFPPPSQCNLKDSIQGSDVGDVNRKSAFKDRKAITAVSSSNAMVPTTYFKQFSVLRRLRGNVRTFVSQKLYKLEAKYGYFLPYRISSRRRDEFFSRLQSLAQSGKVENALIICSAIRRGLREAIVQGAQDGGVGAKVYLLQSDVLVVARIFARLAGSEGSQYIPISFPSRTRHVEDLASVVDRIKEEHGNVKLDLIVIDGSRLEVSADGVSELGEKLIQTKYIILIGLSSSLTYEYFRQLSRRLDWRLLIQGADRQDGYAIFERELVL